MLASDPSVWGGHTEEGGPGGARRGQGGLSWGSNYLSSEKKAFDVLTIIQNICQGGCLWLSAIVQKPSKPFQAEAGLPFETIPKTLPWGENPQLIVCT